MGWLQPYNPFSVPDSKDELYNYAFWGSLQTAGLHGFIRGVTGEAYRGTASIAFEAYTGHQFKKVAGRAAVRAGPVAVPLVIALAAHQTVMNPKSDYYIAPETPLLPGRGGVQLFGGDVSSKLLTAAAQDFAAFML